MNDAAGVAVCNSGNDLLKFVPRVAFPHTTVSYQMIFAITHKHLHFTLTRWQQRHDPDKQIFILFYFIFKFSDGTESIC